MQDEYYITTPWYRGMFVTSQEFIKPLDWRYTLEKWIYGVSSILGFFAFIYMVRKLVKTERKDLVLAARLLSYKISLTVADVIILFIYAPAQFIWITVFWWYGGDLSCRLFKFFSTFAFHLTANMQVLIAFDRLYITATMSTCRLTKKKSEVYNTGACLLGAWSLALLCSCPQLYIFGVAQTGEGNYQCVSLWLQKRMEYVDQLEYLKLYDNYLQDRENTSSHVYFPNGTAKYVIPSPEFSEETITDAATQLMYFEQIYNVIHLLTICVLPYLLELLCYTVILYILKGAQHGYFMTITDVIKTKLCCFTSPHPKQRLVIDQSRSTSRGNSLVPRCVSSLVVSQNHSSPPMPHTSFETIRSENEVSEDNSHSGKFGNHLQLQQKGAQLFRDRSVSCGNVNEYTSGKTPFLPKKQNSLEEEVVHEEEEHRGGRSFSLFGRELIYERRKDAPVRTWGKLSLHLPRISLHKTEQRLSEPTNLAPWLVTVGSARKKARQKAFWMLSANLLLWSPYCVVGIINAATIFPDFVNFQFVAALVALNAVCNIVL